MSRSNAGDNGDALNGEQLPHEDDVENCTRAFARQLRIDLWASLREQITGSADPGALQVTRNPWQWFCEEPYSPSREQSPKPTAANPHEKKLVELPEGSATALTQQIAGIVASEVEKIPALLAVDLEYQNERLNYACNGLYELHRFLVDRGSGGTEVSNMPDAQQENEQVEDEDMSEEQIKMT